MSSNKSLTKNSIFYLIYNVLNVIFPFVTGIYVAHVLLPDNIGQVETARNLAQYFIILSFLGIPTYGLREISKVRNDKEKLSILYSELFCINGISTLIFLSVYILLIFLVPIYRERLVLFLIAGIGIFLNFFNNSWLYEGLEKFSYIAIRNIIFKAASFILLLIFVKSENDYINYAIITVVGTAGNYLINMIGVHRYVTFSFREINLLRHMKSIMYLVVVNLAIEIYSLIDVTMLGFMCNDENVTFYAYGQKIYKVLLHIINTFTVVLVPRIAFYFKENKIDEFNRLLTKTLTIILLIAIPAIIGIWFTADYLLTAVYGADYSASVLVLKILSLILVVSPIGYLLGSRVLLVTGNEKKMIIPVGIGAIVNVILNAILIYYFMETGAALASLISEFVVMAIYLFLGRKFVSLQKEVLFDSLYKILIASALMILFLVMVSFLPLNEFLITLIKIIGAIIIYSISLLLLKEPNIYAVLKKIMKKVQRNG